MRCLYALFAVVIVSTLCGSSAVLALANVSRSFTASDTAIVSGSLVSAVANTPGSIELANTGNADRLVGVVVPLDQSLLAINAATGSAQVAVNGTADVLVSTLNGDIHTGDQIVVSPISGVGMKALAALRSVGVAQGELTAQSAGTTERTIQDQRGNNTTVHIGRIPVEMIIGYAATPTSGDQGILGNIQAFASAIAGHNVSVLQTVLSFVVALIAITALIALVYGAIQGSLISIGRNPLAGSSIYKSLLRVVGMAALIVIVTVTILYLTLRP